MTKILKRRILNILTLLICIGSFSQAPYGKAGMQTEVRLDTATDYPPHGFYEYLPQDFNPLSNKKYPVMFFFPGLGEKGNGTTDLKKMLDTGVPKIINNGKHFPCIVISPQDKWGYPSFIRMYNYVVQKYPIDLDRVYLTGLSAGGGVTWKAAEAHTDKIAAILPICGANIIGNPSDHLQNMPIWAHHNFKDTKVHPRSTITNVNHIANNNKNVMEVYPYGPNKTVANTNFTMQYNTITQEWSAGSGINSPDHKMSFTLYKYGDHNAWDKTYSNQNVWDWLFAQTKRPDTSSTSDFKHEKYTKFTPLIKTSSEDVNITANRDIDQVVIYDLYGNEILKQKNSIIHKSSIPLKKPLVFKVKSSTGEYAYLKLVIK
ncbi:carboxylesterase family protein [Flavivirga eckloniae]|uniref:Alpha/beta hydrolase n=1 Tax=Flavivirga eckloniae TaxID=1803846 RepID=A0A2K9PW75_9FLAO|nr:prolyl oligopeptidase family serine peptidase [Flavivirga eckloniae]AUP81321.1 hypothetical protein C1H87_22410 [Flavivirga eckloniae]